MIHIWMEKIVFIHISGLYSGYFNFLKEAGVGGLRSDLSPHLLPGVSISPTDRPIWTEKDIKTQVTHP